MLNSCRNTYTHTHARTHTHTHIHTHTNTFKMKRVKATGKHLLQKMGALGRLQSIGVVDYVRNVFGFAQSSYLLQPAHITYI